MTEAATTTTPLLAIDSVRAEYGDTVALHDVSLEIGDNGFFALLGPSGSGKTTLLRAIAGFETPTAGRILLDGEDVVALPPHRRPVNMMFQSYALFPHMSVEKNIAYGLQADRVDRAEVRARVGEVLDVVGLAHLAKRRPAQLSGGQQQRVALARAIVKRPRLLLLDEPLSALDRKVRAEMQMELKRLQHEVGMTFVIVTHDQEEAMSVADRIAVLNNGRIEQLDTPEALYSRPASLFVADFIGSANLVEATATATGVALAGFGELPVSHEFAAGEPVVLVVRPESVRIDPSTGPAVPAMVAEVAFLGGSSVLELDVPAVGRALDATVPGASRLRRGDAAMVGLDAAQLVAVQPEASASNAPATADPAGVQVVSG